jgi:hypothetical protein
MFTQGEQAHAEASGPCCVTSRDARRVEAHLASGGPTTASP